MVQASKRLFPCLFCARVVKHSHLRGHLRAYSHSRIRRLRLKACRRARSITPSLTVSNTEGSSPSAARRQLRWRKAGYSCSYCMPHMSPYVSLEEPNHLSFNLVARSVVCLSGTPWHHTRTSMGVTILYPRDVLGFRSRLARASCRTSW